VDENIREIDGTDEFVWTEMEKAKDHVELRVLSMLRKGKQEDQQFLHKGKSVSYAYLTCT